MIITSTSNPKVKRIVTLKKKRKAREEEGVFLTEGIRMFREVPNELLKEIYVTEAFYRKEKDMVDRLTERTGVKAELVSDTVFDYMSDTKTPQGVLLVVQMLSYGLGDVTKGQNPYLIVLDCIQDPGNMGTMLRTAEAAGVTGIVMSKECVDIYNPKTIRSTMGSIYRMPFYYAEDITDAVRVLEKSGIHTYAAHLEGEHLYEEEDYRSACAFLIGNEGNGLRSEVAEQAKTYIRIPMEGCVESLNAAVAAAVLMFEVSRQRRSP